MLSVMVEVPVWSMLAFALVCEAIGLLPVLFLIMRKRKVARQSSVVAGKQQAAASGLSGVVARQPVQPSAQVGVQSQTAVRRPVVSSNRAGQHGLPAMSSYQRSVPELTAEHKRELARRVSIGGGFQISDVQSMLSMSRERVLSLINTGKLACYRDESGRVWVTAQSVASYLESLLVDKTAERTGSSVQPSQRMPVGDVQSAGTGAGVQRVSAGTNAGAADRRVAGQQGRQQATLFAGLPGSGLRHGSAEDAGEQGDDGANELDDESDVESAGGRADEVAEGEEATEAYSDESGSEGSRRYGRVEEEEVESDDEEADEAAESADEEDGGSDAEEDEVSEEGEAEDTEEVDEDVEEPEPAGQSGARGSGTRRLSIRDVSIGSDKEFLAEMRGAGEKGVRGSRKSDSQGGARRRLQEDEVVESVSNAEEDEDTEYYYGIAGKRVLYTTLDEVLERIGRDDLKGRSWEKLPASVRKLLVREEA